LAKPKDTGENYADPTDLASADQDQSFELRMRDRERRLLKKINEALERMAEGTFGVCEECGEEIGEKRLLARPVTTLCVNCKSVQELEERKRGDL
jgi:DnaK suppressor protein